MKTPAMTLLALLAACAAQLGCTEEEAPPGEPGGPCLVGAEPCVSGYACINGVCSAAQPDVGVPSYRAEVDFPAEPVPADGETAVEFVFTIETVSPDGERRAYDPEVDGPLFLTPIPTEAGRVDPARPLLIDGLGIADFVPCARGVDPLCPESAVIRVARDDAPLESIGDSERFFIVDPTPAEPDMGPPDGGM